MKKIGFLSFGHWTPSSRSQTRSAADTLLQSIDLAVAAQLAEMSLDEFKALNPQFKRPVITGDDRTKILLPQKNAEKFHLNLAQWGQALSSWTTHRITGAKESITSLAAKFGTTPDVIRQANNIPAQTRLKAGSTILVPKTSASAGADIADHIVDTAVMALEAGEKTAQPAILILQGTDDANVPLEIPRRFVAAYEKAGGPIQIEWFQDAPHGFGRIEVRDQGDKTMRQLLQHRITFAKLPPNALSRELPDKRFIMRALCHRVSTSAASFPFSSPLPVLNWAKCRRQGLFPGTRSLFSPEMRFLHPAAFWRQIALFERF